MKSFSHRDGFLKMNVPKASLSEAEATSKEDPRYAACLEPRSANDSKEVGPKANVILILKASNEKRMLK